MPVRTPSWATGLLSALLILTGASCGYHTSSNAGTIPQSIHTIAIVPFNNGTPRYKLSDQFQKSLSREFIARSKFKITRDPNTADAVLDGQINNVLVIPIIYDPVTSKTTVVQITVYMNTSLTDRATGKILFSKTNFGVSNNYQLSLFTNQFFDESPLALQRISTDMARSVVAAILEDF